MAPTGIELIAAERQKHEGKGWDSEHDDTQDQGELALAAAAYALHAAHQDDFEFEVFRLWPWSSSYWKPKHKLADLVRAGALIAAEIDRLQRAAAKED